MKSIILAALVGVLVSGPAWGTYRNSHTSYIAAPCTTVLKLYATAKLVERKGQIITYNSDFDAYLGWIAGYMTRVNETVPGKENHFRDLFDEVGWVASWCRDNTSSTLVDAMEALTKIRTRGR